MLKISLLAIMVIFCAGILALSVRGLPGNPDVDTLTSSEWQGSGPFESSNERGRFALTYSFIENHSLQFSRQIAQFATPDLAITGKGEYVSLFAPGTSFLIMPGYLAGKFLGASQVGAFVVVVIFALMNTLLIYVIAKRLGAYPLAAALGALAFLFATPAFTYAVSLSQHHFSVFALLLSLYLLIRWNNWWSLSLVWFLCALSIVIDNPNVFLMFPVGVYALGRILLLKRSGEGLQFSIRLVYILTFLMMIIPLAFFAWFNQNSNGNAFQLAGTLKRVLSVDQTQTEVQTDVEKLSVNIHIKSSIEKVENNKEKTAVGFFQTRNLWNGFYVHFISADRGIVWFTPIVLLGIFGFIFLFQVHRSITAVIVASIGVNILLYSMWGDPWGGWAFGSRYLIPTYALLSIGLGIALTQWRKNIIFLVIFLVLFIYSVRINTLGALGTSTIPPQVEVLALEKLTGKVQKYDFERSRDYLYEQGSKSFVYNVFIQKYMTAPQYYTIVSSLIVIMGSGMLLTLWFISRKEKI
jgi:hypothetical protein